MPASVVASTADASWLPPGGRADVVLDPGGSAPTATGLVRLLVRRGTEVFCTPREGSLKVDLPTREVPASDDGRATVESLMIDVLGRSTEATLVGYVRNVVDAPDAGYPWPTPLAHFCVWQAEGEPVVDGSWLSTTDPGSPLRDRHWWPLVRALGT